MATEYHGPQPTQDAHGSQGQGQEGQGYALQSEARASSRGAPGQTAATTAAITASLKARIEALEAEITAWRRKNSQSNPDAVWDLRELKKNLEHWKAQLAAHLHLSRF